MSEGNPPMRPRWRWGSTAAGALLALAVLAGCDQQQPPPPAPMMAPKPGSSVTSPVIFADGIYPGQGANQGAFELDAPLRTTAGTAYFGFQVNYRVEGLRFLELSFASDGAPVPLQRLDGPCDIGAAAYNRDVEALIDAGTPLLWTTCRESGSDEVIAPDNSAVDTNLAILLPASLVGSGGTLTTVARNLTGGPPGPPSTVVLRPAPIWLGLIGDSVAWGQGVPPGGRFADLIRDEIIRRGRAATLIAAAHSGATVNEPDQPATVAEAVAGAGDCARDRDVPGEVPRSRPTIQCQAGAISRVACTTDSADFGVRAPRWFCGDDPVPPGLTSPVTVELDAGPRFDLVMMTACINDIGAGDLTLGWNGLADPETLRTRIETECNLTNGLADLRLVVPNAAVVISGYHLWLSELSDPARSGCAPFAPPPPQPPLLTGVLDAIPIAVNASAVPLRVAMSRQVLAFRADSDRVLEASAAALNGGRAGRGTVLFVSQTTAFAAANAAFAPLERVFPLACAGALNYGPVDPVAGERAGACRAFNNPEGRVPLPPAEEQCRRASAFHPDAAGHAAIAATIIADLERRGLFPSTP